MNKHLDMEYIDKAIAYYNAYGLEYVERLLESWMSEPWSKSPYKDVLTPALIQRKLELNEEEY